MLRDGDGGKIKMRKLSEHGTGQAIDHIVSLADAICLGWMNAYRPLCVGQQVIS